MKSEVIHRNDRGFTLVELLVVLAVIAVLMSMLLPALKASREMAKTIKCQGNLRQAHFGFSAYAVENRGHWIVGSYGNVVWSRIVMYKLGLKYTGEQPAVIPAGAWNQGASDQGYGDPNLYVHDYSSKSRKNQIMKCPTENFTNYWGGENATSYRFNSGLTYGYGLGVGDYYTITSAKAQWGRVKENQLEKPSGTFVIGDGIIDDGSFDYEMGGISDINRIATYHGGGANFLYTDGHAGHVMKINATTAMFDRRK